MSRLKARFDALAAEGRSAFMTYLMAGDPDLDRALAAMKALPGAGADIIELGAPFTDPMADGPAIQAAGQRALAGGVTMDDVLAMVRAFRAEDQTTPVVVMGYYNPIYVRGPARYAQEAAAAGVDGLIIVDLPPEEADELLGPAKAAGLDVIRLATPTTRDDRLPAVLNGSSGFVYYVSITGVTGAAAAEASAVAPDVARIKAATDLPVCVGFGVRTPDTAAEIARVADGVVVGSAIVHMLGDGTPLEDVMAFVASLAQGVRAGSTA